MALLSQSAMRKKSKFILYIIVFLCVLKLSQIFQTSVETKDKRVPGQDCQEKTNIVFIKILKCAGTTLTGILRRFGYVRDLQLVLPVRKQLYLNYPTPKLTKNIYRWSTRKPNMLIDHAVLAEQDMAELMPGNTVYISCIRHPFAQLRSSYAFFSKFGLSRFTGIPDTSFNPVNEYVSELDKYEQAYQMNKARINKCHPDGFSIHRNIMSHFLGMPLGFPAGTANISGDVEAIQRYIQHLDDKFTFIMITEYFIESLIMLRRLMCWTFKDIVFINQNVIQYKDKFDPIPDHILKTHQRWSNADYMLYEYFNSSLWRRINNEGVEDFFDEVKTFKRVQNQVTNYCAALFQMRDPNRIPPYLNETKFGQTRWNAPFSILPKDCSYLQNPYPLLFKMQDESSARDPQLTHQQEKSLQAEERAALGKKVACSKAVP